MLTSALLPPSLSREEQVRDGRRRVGFRAPKMARREAEILNLILAYLISVLLDLRVVVW